MYIHWFQHKQEPKIIKIALERHADSSLLWIQHIENHIQQHKKDAKGTIALFEKAITKVAQVEKEHVYKLYLEYCLKSGTDEQIKSLFEVA